jgi:threonine dehydratase
VITKLDVAAAAERIAGRVRRTPVIEADPGWLKLEYLQHTGSFKPRGAFNRVLAAREAGELDPRTGIVVASGGNAGLANAYAAATLGVPATVFLPTSAPPVKVAKLHAYGATVVRAGEEYATAYEAAVKHAADTGAVYCHAYDQPEIVAGAGTLGTEILDELGGVDTVVLAVGGGGLMAGVAAAVDGAARVVAVEPVTIPTLHAALAAGAPVDVPVSGIAADSLGARRIGEIAFSVAVRTGVRSVLVDDAAIIDARRMLWDRWRIAVEHGAAAALAGLGSGAYVPEPGERMVIVLCGANTDPADLR